MNLSTDLFLPLISKQGLVVIKLANLFLTQQRGDRLEPVQYYAERFKTGVGTVYSAFSYLKDIGAVQLESKGHLGTFVCEVNYPLIWSLTGQNQIVGGMPLPYSKRYEGLATGLYDAFNRAGIALNLVYTRGALNRLRALTGGKFDFVILSRFSFKYAINNEIAIEEVLSLGRESYVGQHIILLRDNMKEGIEDGMRIGIDPSSIDQVLFAKAACHKKKVEFIEMNYMNLMSAMQMGQIDATIWNSDDFYASSLPFKAIAPATTEVSTETDGNTEATIAVERGNKLVLQTLKSILDVDSIRDIQNKVIEQRLMPEY